MQTTLCSAIANRQVITFLYEGLSRTVYPVAYGTHVDTGNEALRAYQVGGETSSPEKPLPSWRFFLIDKVQNVKLTGETFAIPLPGYRPNDRHLNVVCQL